MSSVLHAQIPLQNIPSDLPALSDVHTSQLALVQLRSLPTDGGLDLLAMGDVAIPAYYTAHLRHFRQLLQEGEHGPFLPPVITRNLSTSLFSTSFHQAQAALESREAVLVHSEGDIHPPLIFPDMILPHHSIFQANDVASGAKGIAKILTKTTNQKYLAKWYRTVCPTRQNLLRLRTAFSSLDTRLAHISPTEYTGNHTPFDIHHKIHIGHQPNAFLKTFLPTQQEGMSQYQMSLYLKLLLGLPIPALLESSSVCPCGQNHDFHGYHRLNCKQNAGRANRAAHDLVQLALKKEFQRLGLSVVDNDNEMRRRYAHLSSQKRGDLAILSDKNYVIYDQVRRQPKHQAIADIKMVSLVNSQGTWTAATRRNKDKIENPGLVQQEQTKNRKHAAFYSQIGYAFFAFAVSCFGSLGPTAVRCLFSLADLESRQQESLFARQNLPPMDPSARSQFRAICYRQISARIGHAVAKASVMRLLGVPRLPLPSPVPRYALAQNCPGPADSFSHPVPTSYASSLLSLPPSSSASPSPASSP